MEEAAQQLVASLQISRREGFKDALAPTLRALSWHAYWRGHFPPAIHFAQEGVSVARDIHDGFHELYCLANLSLAQWSLGDYQRAFSVTHGVMTKAHERQNMFFLSRMKNHLGWFYRELGAVSRAAELDQESTDLGHTHGIANVEISALINLGLDYLALDQHARAVSYLEPTLDRVAREGFGTHRRRWQMKLSLGSQRYRIPQARMIKRYVMLKRDSTKRREPPRRNTSPWAGHYVARSSRSSEIADAAGTELQHAFSLAEQLQSPSLLYPIAYDLGTGTKRQERNVKQRPCMAKPKPLSRRWQRLWRMRRCARPSCNRRWCKKFTNGLHGWASNTP